MLARLAPADPATALAAARMGGGLEPAPDEIRRALFPAGGLFPGLRHGAARAFPPADGGCHD
jgi:hypothetical protein